MGDVVLLFVCLQARGICQVKMACSQQSDASMELSGDVQLAESCPKISLLATPSLPKVHSLVTNS